ncbi:MAG TPA: VOC family protein [Candidatus Binataceae bacterium]|nr:VOC family protein [Candidatus Binataceae bacterium]
MELNLPQVDVGLFTNRINEMKAFYGGTLGLQFDSELPIGDAFTQHRFAANGSIIKLMEARNPLPRRHPGGYETIIIASNRFPQPEAFNDPDGNSVVFVPPGRDDVNQIEVRLGVSDVDRFDAFYTGALGAVAIGGHRYRIGETVFATFRHPLAKAVRPAPLANLLEVVKAMAVLGIRYISIHVKDCDAAFQSATAAGATIGVAPATFGTVARAAFVRDPDGNFIELAVSNLKRG